MRAEGISFCVGVADSLVRGIKHRIQLQLVAFAKPDCGLGGPQLRLLGSYRRSGSLRAPS